MDETRAARATEPDQRTVLTDTTVGDHDVALGVLVKFGAVLVVVGVVVFVAMWVISSRIKTSLERRDPEPRAIMAGRTLEAPPGPRLQSDPNRDLATLRAEENAALESYAWLSPDRSVARIPVARAMEIVLASGLPKGMGAGAAGPPAATPPPASTEPKR